MLTLSELNVVRDLVDIKFKLNSDLEVGTLKYFVEVKNWTNEEIQFYFNFTEPLQVSKGEKPDLLILTIKNPELFVTKTG